MPVNKEAALARFKGIFPQFAGDIAKWTPNKDGSIRVELSGKRFFIFHYLDDRTWCLMSQRYKTKQMSDEEA